MLVKIRSLAINAVGALFKFIEGLNDMQLAPKSIRLRLENDANLTLIDSSTTRALELVSNARNPKSSNSLFGILDMCRTSNGRKTLRANILQPPCSMPCPFP